MGGCCYLLLVLIVAVLQWHLTFCGKANGNENEILHHSSKKVGDRLFGAPGNEDRNASKTIIMQMSIYGEHYAVHRKMTESRKSQRHKRYITEISGTDRNTTLTNQTLLDSELLRRVKIVKQARQLKMYQAGLAIHRFWLPIIIPIGLAGNILSFLVMARPENRRTSFGVFVCALAISDSMMLVVSTVFWTTTVLLPAFTFTNDGCGMFKYFFELFSTYGDLLILVMTMDRYCAVKYPLLANRICTAQRAKWMAIALFIYDLVYCIPQFFYAQRIDNNRFCAAFAGQFSEYDTFGAIYFWLSVLVSFVIPVIAICILNTSIMREVKNSGKFFIDHNYAQVKVQTELSTLAKTCGSAQSRDDCVTESMGLQTDKPNDVIQRKSRDSQMVVILMMVSLVLMTLTLPQYIRYTMYGFIQYYSSADVFAEYFLIYNISNKMYITNSAVNFFLYSFSGTKFRRDLRKLFKLDNNEANGISVDTSNCTSYPSQTKGYSRKASLV